MFSSVLCPSCQGYKTFQSFFVSLDTTVVFVPYFYRIHLKLAASIATHTINTGFNIAHYRKKRNTFLQKHHKLKIVAKMIQLCVCHLKDPVRLL